MTDTIKPTFTFNELEKIEKSMTPEPFSFGIGHTVITFPDPMGLSTERSFSRIWSRAVRRSRLCVVGFRKKMLRCSSASSASASSLCCCVRHPRTTTQQWEIWGKVAPLRSAKPIREADHV